MAPRPEGRISLSSTPGSLYADATFPSAGSPTITGTPLDENCSLTIDEPDARPATVTPASDSAGDIVIEVPSASKSLRATLEFSPATRAYEPMTLEGPTSERVDQPNALIRIQAAGGESSATAVPAFDTTIATAAHMRIDEPAEGSVVPKSGDLVVRWTDAGNKALIVSLIIGNAKVACSFKPADGKGIVPGTLVQKAAASVAPNACVGNACVMLTAFALHTSHVIAGDVDVSITHGVGARRMMKLN